VVVDCETFAIGPRPGAYPPEPVGVAISWPNGSHEYLAFGHPAGDNNCTRDVAIRAVRYAYSMPVVFHNGAFDMEVLWKWFGLPFPKVWHDTLLLAYLQSPDEPTYALKPLATKFLGMPPEQQDVVKDWILKNIPEAKPSNFGAFIAYAPVALVKPYAIGDVVRTRKLFEHFAPTVLANMREPYRRERRLTPHLKFAELRGIRVDRALLNKWEVELTYALTLCDLQIKTALNDTTLNLDSDEELANALDREGLMTHWETPDGIPFGAVGVEPPSEVSNPFGNGTIVVSEGKPQTRSMSKGALQRCCKDQRLVEQLLYRNGAATMLRTFVQPWLQKSATDGRLHTNWHQVRGVDKNGTRTGRIASADPNLANVPNPNETPPPFGLPPLPQLRKALLPEEGHVWISADYSQQELRITAHYENGQMKAAYLRDPRLDLHAFAQNLIALRIKKTFPRKHIKNVAFASIYGAGVPKLARMMGTSEIEAEEVRDEYFAALPGLPALISNVKARTRERGYVLSLGGRYLTVEPPKTIKGKYRTFDYKQTNKLIQGSAADQTKQAIVDYCESGGSIYFLSQVYDEINISVPQEFAFVQARKLKECMVNALPLSVPMLVDIKCGPTWGDLSEMQVPT